MSDKEIREIELWIADFLAEHPTASAPELISAALKESQPFSSSDLVWAIWYLAAEGRLEVSRDHVVSAA